jgi:hypothetical protein
MQNSYSYHLTSNTNLDKNIQSFCETIEVKNIKKLKCINIYSRKEKFS